MFDIQIVYTLCKIRKYFILKFAIIFPQPLHASDENGPFFFVYLARRWRIHSSMYINTLNMATFGNIIL